MAQRIHGWLMLLLLAVALLVGVLAGGYFLPVASDREFWREFWVSPAVGGLAAVLAAIVAFFASRHVAREQRRAAQRAEWWERAEWALNRAISIHSHERDAGLRALMALVDTATDTEADIIAGVTSALYAGTIAGGERNEFQTE
ncbi:hypothetical protein GCM10027417_21750 [Glutamicibacter endophyticus]